MVTMLQTLLLIIVAFLGIPVGKLIAKNTKEELKSGRRYFAWISGLCLLILVADLFLSAFKAISFEDTLMTFAIFTFIFLLTLQSLRKANKLMIRK